MTWFKVCDTFAFHPKRVACSPAAIGLWVVAGSWCSSQLTDGHVPRSVLALLGGTVEAASELVAARLWHETGTGWVFHSWDEYQPSKAEVHDRLTRLRRLAKAGGKASGAKRGASTKTKRAASTEDEHRASTEVQPARLNLSPTGPVELSVPSRPVPEEILISDTSSQDHEPHGVLTPGGAVASVAQSAPPPGGLPVVEANAQRRAAKGARKPPAADLDPPPPGTLHADAYEALMGDPTLAPICQRPVNLTADLLAIGPGVDVAAEVAKAGAWLRANPTRRKSNGNKFLVGWVTRAQEGHRGRGGGYQRPLLQERNLELEASPTDGKGWVPEPITDSREVFP